MGGQGKRRTKRMTKAAEGEKVTWQVVTCCRAQWIVVCPWVAVYTSGSFRCSSGVFECTSNKTSARILCALQRCGTYIHCKTMISRGQHLPRAVLGDGMSKQIAHTNCCTSALTNCSVAFAMVKGWKWKWPTEKHRTSVCKKFRNFSFAIFFSWSMWQNCNVFFFQ